MKDINIFKSIAILTLFFMFQSCVAPQDPEAWAVEIEDSYRIQVSMTFAHAGYTDDVLAAFAEKLDNEAQQILDESSIKDADCPKYKLALEKMAKSEEMASEMLEVYNLWEVKFSEWTKQPDQDGFSIWTATETNTDIKVTFKNNSLLEWDLDLDDETLTAFIIKMIASLNGETQDVTEEELGLGDIGEDVDEDPAVELIHARICDQYHGWYTDDKIMSKDFYSVFHKAQQADDSEIGWPDWDYWRCTQGAEAKLSTVEIDMKSPTSAIAHLTLLYPEIDSQKRVDLPMVFENGNWFVDDIISYEELEIFSLKNAAKSKIQ